MWYTKVPDFPFGKPEIRWLLVLRGTGGMVGVYGFYFSLQYLPVAEALLLSFVTPLITAYTCSLLLHEPFAIKQLYAGLISLLGIVLIAHPVALFGGAPDSASDSDNVTPAQRLSAIIWGMVSVLGATCAYTTIRVIGPRAHPLVSVNYYAFMSTLLSSTLLFLPSSIYSESFRLPHGAHEWGLLIGLGMFGFLLQFLMTAGLVRDKSGRATNMMYSSIVFGLLLDWAVWGVVPGWMSALGGTIVVSATIWGALQKPPTEGAKGPRDEEYAMVPGGEGAFLVEDDADSSDEDDGMMRDDDDGGKKKIRTSVDVHREI